MSADLYTFILDAGGGTYVSQIRADELEGAIILWAENADEDIVSAFSIDGTRLLVGAVRDTVSDVDMGPVALNGLESVWFMYILVNNVGGNLNIVKTSG